MKEEWERIKGMRISVVCDFCWTKLKPKSWVWRSKQRGVYECNGCRKEAWRAEKARVSVTEDSGGS